MAEKFELNNKEAQADAAENLLVKEGVEMSQLRVKDGAGEKTEAFDAAVNEISEKLTSIALRLGNLPESVKQSFLGSIAGMSGDDFPAYDLLRTAMKKSA